MKYRITIVTICFNNLNDLIKTCVSVDKQTLLPFEHLIIDGSDNNVINSWLIENPQPSYRRWVFERDQGISDAFNKGIRNSYGEIIHLLNSGDLYYINDAVKIASDYFSSDENIMWSHSKYIQHRGDINVITGSPFERKKLWKGMRTIGHPTMFVKRELYEKYGLFDTSLKLAMDYDFILRIRNEKFVFIPEPLVFFSPGGVSTIQFNKALKEIRESHNKHIGPSTRLSLWQFRQKILQRFMQTAVGKKWFAWKNRKTTANPAIS